MASNSARARPRLALALTLALLSTTVALSPLWTRTEALRLANHPLVVQLGTGALPRGSFERVLLAREVLVQSLEAAAKSAVSGDEVSPSAAHLLSLVFDERARLKADTQAWSAACDSAGKTIDLPASEAAAGVSCYNCGGNHYNIDCPDELRASAEAQALAGYLRGAPTLAGCSIVLRDVAFSHATLLAAGLDGGCAYSDLIQAHALRWTAMADACDTALRASGALGPDTLADAAAEGAAAEGAAAEGAAAEGAAAEEAKTARALLFAFVDSEASVAGLKDTGSTADGTRWLSVQAAREAIEAVQPGFLGQQDKHSAYVRESVVGAATTPASGAVGGVGAAGKAADAKAKVAKAAAYLQARQAAGSGVSADAKAVLAAKAGGSQAAMAKKYLELRSKQQKAAEYLAARKREEPE